MFQYTTVSDIYWSYPTRTDSIMVAYKMLKEGFKVTNAYGVPLSVWIK